jgi:hypothetical protein
MQLEYVINEQLCNSLCSKRVSKGEKMGILCESINNYQDAILVA